MPIGRTILTAAVPLLFAGSLAAEPEACVVEQNFYYPKEGMAEEALAVRTKAAEVRAALGLPAGRVFVVEHAVSGHPARGESEPRDVSYLMSEIEYESEEAMEAAHARLLESEDYLAARAKMGSLLEHFEAATWRPVWGGCR